MQQENRGWVRSYVSPAKRRFWTVYMMLGGIVGIAVARIYHYAIAIPVGFVCGLLGSFAVAAVRGKDTI